ncbi:MAG: hypothetical protein ACI8X5_003920 [Planctomycetota bacterium]|jgi:hypothetical protein
MNSLKTQLAALPVLIAALTLSSIGPETSPTLGANAESTRLAENPNTVVWEGDAAIGKGKHIVFIAGDHEYRGEETLPALARIMAKHYGFKCTFIVTTNPKTGEIEPGSNHITNLEALKSADLMVIFTRFQSFEDSQMKQIDDYLKSGRPVLGLRTSTHGFNGLKGEYERYNEGYNGEHVAWKYGFGERILGEHWVGHFGRNHVQSSNLILEDSQKDHPILRGVKNPHVVCGGYVGHPVEGSVTLALGQVLDGMTPDSPPADNEKQRIQHAVAWTRSYDPSKASSRVFATTHGASQDILNEGFRRMLINAQLWCMGMESSITADSPVDFVGPYNPIPFGFGSYRRGVKPADLSGFDTPIYDASKATSDPEKEE